MCKGSEGVTSSAPSSLLCVDFQNLFGHISFICVCSERTHLALSNGTPVLFPYPPAPHPAPRGRSLRGEPVGLSDSGWLHYSCHRWPVWALTCVCSLAAGPVRCDVREVCWKLLGTTSCCDKKRYRNQQSLRGGCVWIWYAASAASKLNEPTWALTNMPRMAEKMERLGIGTTELSNSRTMQPPDFLF